MLPKQSITVISFVAKMCVKFSNIPVNKFVCRRQFAGSDKNDGKWDKLKQRGETDFQLFSFNFCNSAKRNIAHNSRKKTDIGVDETGSKSYPRFSSEQSFERRRVVVLFV